MMLFREKKRVGMLKFRNDHLGINDEKRKNNDNEEMISCNKIIACLIRYIFKLKWQIKSGR